MQNMPSGRAMTYGVTGVIAGVIVLVLAINAIGSFKAVGPGEVCVVQEGGPFDGRGVKEVRQPSSGISNIGMFNHQRCFPATTRNYLISADATGGDRQGVDVFHAPTKDSVLVGVEGQALFTLNTDAAVIEDFYRRFGVRTFSGLHPYDGDDGWSAFLDVQFRPVLDNALREELGKNRCAALNAACAVIKGGDDVKDTDQNIVQVQTGVERTLAADLNDTLGGPYFQNVRFRLQQIRLPAQLEEAIAKANSARANVETQRLNAEAASNQARAARRLAKAYRSNPYAGLIEFAKSLPEDSRPIINMNLGGGRGPTLAIR